MSSEQTVSSPSKWLRQFHRWMSIAFVAAVVISFIGLRQDQPPTWLSFIALPPLALLTLTGLYLFSLPYVSKWRSARRYRTGATTI